MNHPANIWLLRVASIPAALFIPLTATILVGVTAREFGCQDYLLYALAFVTFVISTCVAISLASVTVFASRRAPLAERSKVLRYMAIFDIGAFLASQLIALPSRAYDRVSLEFDVVRSPTINVSGTWKGEWSDPRKDVKQEITLTLQQQGNSVEGMIIDDTGTKWRIIEGVVSGDSLNLFYDKEFAWRSAGATLLGSLENGQLSGHYYGHERPKPGWSSKGPWHATKQP